MGISITLPHLLAYKVSKIAKSEGYESAEKFVKKLIENKIQEYETKTKSKNRVFKIAKEIRKAMMEAGLTEDEIIEDFERFTKTLDRETFVKELEAKNK